MSAIPDMFVAMPAPSPDASLHVLGSVLSVFTWIGKRPLSRLALVGEQYIKA
jgi:hypothetical protein